MFLRRASKSKTRSSLAATSFGRRQPSLPSPKNPRRSSRPPRARDCGQRAQHSRPPGNFCHRRRRPSDGRRWKTAPGIAPTAIQQGRYVAKILKNLVPKEKRRLSNTSTKATWRPLENPKRSSSPASCSFPAYRLARWCFIHVVYLVGFKNRLVVMMQWFFVFLTGQRGARLIYRR